MPSLQDKKKSKNSSGGDVAQESLRVSKRVFKPEDCPSHNFAMERDGTIDFSAYHEVTDDSICYNCGLYFSTWMWQSANVNKMYTNGADIGAGEAISYLARKVNEASDPSVRAWGSSVIDELRSERTKRGGAGWLHVLTGSN